MSLGWGIPQSLALRACWPWSRLCGGGGTCRQVGVREMGSGVSRDSSAPRLEASVGGVPSWDAFPEVNRAVAGRLLGQLVERMICSAASGRGGGERGECGGEVAVG